MGVLTVSMTALRDAIVSSRQARVALLGDLALQTGERRERVSTLCAGFASDRAGAHCAWFGPAAVRLSRRGLEETARAKAPLEETPPAAQPSLAPLPRAKKRSVKGLKKH